MRATPRIVIKVGGAQISTDEGLAQLLSFVRKTTQGNQQVVLVHGGGKDIGRIHQQLGVPFATESGLRVTSDESMEIVTMVLAGLVNKRLVSMFVNAGVSAIGVCGSDLGIMRSEPINAERLGRVGGPPKVNVQALETMMQQSEIAVVSPVCLGDDGGLLNVNADMVAQSVAIALRADQLDFVTDVEGIRAENGVLRKLDIDGLRALLGESVVTGGMIPKVQAALGAVTGGVGRVRMGHYESLGGNTATEVCG